MKNKNVINHQPQRLKGLKEENNITCVSENEESVAKKIVDAAYAVHKNLGPGLLEKVYEICFCHELSKRGLEYQRQVKIPIIYEGIIFE